MQHLISICFLLFSISVFAQGPPTYIITGKVVEASTQETIDYATVVAKQKNTGEIINGATTENGGNFKIESNTPEVILEISFIGLQTKTINDINFNGKIADLGTITLGSDAELLDEVVVAAERSTTEFKLDKRVFNVGTDLSSTGAGALEVLNNVPSVNVNIEGEVSLRGATGVQILINGKPSILSDDASNALGTITADMIEKVEVITNPSAKYEAEGTAGIINIVLKKNEKKGLNGSISVNTGIPHNHSVGLSLNRRTDKFNLFTQLGAGYRELPRINRNINRDKTTGFEISSEGDEFRNEYFYNFVLGSDYYINPLNVITLSGSFAYEVEDQPSETNFQSGFNGVYENEWTRTEITEALNPKYQYELQYKKDFPDSKDHQLLFSAIGRFFGKEQSSNFTNAVISGQVAPSDQVTETTFKEGKYTFNLDYTKPFNDNWTIEVGTQFLTNDVSNDFTVLDDISGELIVDTTQTNIFEYDQDVLGVYGTGAYEGDIWGLKLGLRVERTQLKTFLVNTDETNDNTFNNLFPSIHSSYKLSDAISFQAGYSRRIYRPRLWDLNPFFNLRNNFVVRTGNPNLLPEYTDSYEVGSIFIFEELSLNVNAYYRNTTNKIERIFLFQDSITLTRPENIGTNKAVGLELNFKYALSKSLTLTGDANYNVFDRNGEFEDQIFDFTADKWSSKLTAKYKIRKGIDIEFTARNQSREETLQGLATGYTTLDGGLRIKILNGKGVFNLSARDIFASRIREQTFENEENFQFTRSLRGRFLTLGFSYGFGKGEAMQYSGRRR